MQQMQQFVRPLKTRQDKTTENRDNGAHAREGETGARNMGYSNEFNVTIEGGPFTSFGEMSVAEKHREIRYTFPSHIDPEAFLTTVSGSSVAMSKVEDAMAVVTTGDATELMSCTMSSRKHAHYFAGQGLLIQFSAIFESGVVGTQQRVGLGDTTDGLFFGYSGSGFGAFRYCDGAETFMSAATWNGDKCDGTGSSEMVLDPTLPNVYSIQAQMHYMGQIKFRVVSPLHDLPIVGHTIRWSNTAAAASGVTLRTASKPLTVDVRKTASTSGELQVKTASMAVFVEGDPHNDANPRCADVAFSGVADGVEEVMLHLRNRSTVMGMPNHGDIVITSVSVAVDGTKPATLRGYHNSALSGVASGATYTVVHHCASLGEHLSDNTLRVQPRESGTLTASGTVSGLTLVTPSGTTDDHYNDRVVCITSGTGAHQSRRITDYSGGSSFATVSPTWETIPDSGSTYTIENGIQKMCLPMGKVEGARITYPEGHEIHLAPSETFTVTAESAANTDVRLGVTWIEHQ